MFINKVHKASMQHKQQKKIMEEYWHYAGIYINSKHVKLNHILLKYV